VQDAPKAPAGLARTLSAGFGLGKQADRDFSGFTVARIRHDGHYRKPVAALRPNQLLGTDGDITLVR